MCPPPYPSELAQTSVYGGLISPNGGAEEPKNGLRAKNWGSLVPTQTEIMLAREASIEF